MFTIVIYKKEGVTYSHTFNGELPKSVATTRMLMEHHISSNAIERIEWKRVN